MTHRPECVACRATLPSGAAFCPLCGAPTGDLALDEADDHEVATGLPQDVVIARTRRRTALVVVGAVLAAGFAGFVAGRPARNDASSSPSSTAREADTSVASTSTVVATTAASVSTTSAATTPTTAAPYGNCHDLPSFVTTGRPEADVVLGLITREGEVLRLDMTTGQLTCVRMVESRDAFRFSTGSEVHAWRVTGGTIVSQWGEFSTRFVPDDPKAAITHLGPVDGGPASWAYPAGPETVWIVGSFQRSGTSVYLTQVSGLAPAKSYELPAGAQPIQSDERGGVLVHVTGSTFVLATNGSLTRLVDGGALLGWGPNHLLTARADARGTTQVALVDRLSGRTRPLGPLPRELLWTSQGLISPDGRLMALYEGWGGWPVVVDLQDLAITELSLDVIQPSAGSLLWSPEGDRLFWLNGGGTLSTWTPGGKAVRIGRDFHELPLLRDVFLMPANR